MGESVLVVDDESKIRQILQYRLESANYEVRTCDDGRDAVDLLEGEYEPDVLVVDVMMPRLDGIQLVRMLRRGELDVPTDLPVVVLTSRDREEHVLEGFEAGVDDYVAKPFRTAELVARIRRHVR